MSDPMTAPNADLPAVTEGEVRTPRPWPADSWPTAAELADWLSRCTGEERLSYADHSLATAQRAARCVDQQHDALAERLRAVEGERDAAQRGLGEQADIEREAFGRGVAWAMGDDEVTADREALSGEIARVLGEHYLARPYGEKAAWCVCLTWSIDQTTDRLADEHAYEAHLADALADLLAARDRRVRAEALREAAATLEDLALQLVMESDDNPVGNPLAASIVTKCADIVREVKR